MNEETRKLYAAIGRGDDLQYRLQPTNNWTDWHESYVRAGHEDYQWRIKPRMIRVNGVEVPAPLDAFPGDLTIIYTPDLTDDGLYDDWLASGSIAKQALERGIAHATEEAAIAHAKAMLLREPA